MYQFHIQSGSPQQVLSAFRKAVDNGIQWIEVSGDIGLDTLDQIENECRRKGLILTVADNMELLVDKRYHGILFTALAEQQIEHLRQVHGAHPIVGVTLAPGMDFMHFKTLDIDYFLIDVDRHTPSELAAFVDSIHSQWDIPVVGRTAHMSAELAQWLTEAGFNGFCLHNTHDLDYLPNR